MTDSETEQRLKAFNEAIEKAQELVRLVTEQHDLLKSAFPFFFVRPMSTAPRDGTQVHLCLRDGSRVEASYLTCDSSWRDNYGATWTSEDGVLGWSVILQPPAKS